ncbi:MAG: AAA family ATPase, partial [Saccharolobus sp.]
MNLSSFIFERGRIISIYGESGVGKTLLSLQLALDIRPSVFISTEGTDFESRLEKINVGQKTYFIIVDTMLGLYNAVINSTTYHPKLLIIDTANG